MVLIVRREDRGSYSLILPRIDYPHPDKRPGKVILCLNPVILTALRYKTAERYLPVMAPVPRAGQWHG